MLLMCKKQIRYSFGVSILATLVLIVSLLLLSLSSGQEEADLAVFGDDISLSTLEVREGDRVRIYAVVHNLGDDLGSATVEFYDATVMNQEVLIGDDQVVVSAGGLSVASVDWFAEKGDRTILIIISEEIVFDSNISNNQASASFHIFGTEGTVVFTEPTLLLEDANVSIEYSTERTIPIQVRCLGGDAFNVTVRALESSGLEISEITPPRDMSAGESSAFFLRIKAPPSEDYYDSEIRVVLIQARGESARSNIASLEITIHPPVTQVSWWTDPWTATAMAGGVLGAILAVINGTELGRYKFLCFVLPLYTKLKKEEILDHYIRGKIHGYILANPGDHYSSIRKALDVTNSSLTYHLSVLEKEALIRSERDGMYKRFYPKGAKLSEKEVGALTPVQNRIIEAIKETPGICQKDIASMLGVSSSTVNYHISRLVQKGIVRSKRKGMKIAYYFSREPIRSPQDLEKTGKRMSNDHSSSGFPYPRRD